MDKYAKNYLIAHHPTIAAFLGLIYIAVIVLGVGSAILLWWYSRRGKK
jgi:hypothetical protein